MKQRKQFFPQCRLRLFFGFYFALACGQFLLPHEGDLPWLLAYGSGLVAHGVFMVRLQSASPRRLFLFSLLLPVCGYPLAFYYLGEVGFSSWLLQVVMVNFVLFTGQVLLRILSEEVVLYIVFGGLTTVVSLGSFIAFSAVWPKQAGVQEIWFGPKVFSFVLAILFAFWSNRRFVFQSHGLWWTEFAAFVGSRVLTSASFELGGLWLCVSVFGWRPGLSNLLVVGAVVVANYFWSKHFVFQKGV